MAIFLQLIFRDNLPSDDFIAQAKKHLASDCYKNMTEGAFDEFKLALYEYIPSLGEASAEALIETLAKTVPEEKRLMITAAERLRQEGLQEGLHRGRYEIAKKLFSRGGDFHYVKEITELPDEELAELSPERKKSISSSPTPLEDPRVDQLAQSIAVQTASGGINIKTAADSKNGVVSRAHKRLKDA